MEHNQELMMQLQMYEQHIRALQEQLQAVEQAILETSSLNLGLDDVKESRGKDVLASIGKGIFIPAKIVSDELLVDVGGKHFVKKSVSETQKLITSQIEKLRAIQQELEGKLDEINQELTKTFMDAQTKASEK